MQRNISYILSLLLVVSLFSCKKKTDDLTPSNDPSLTTKVDGTVWTAKNFTASYRYDVFVLNAKSASGQSIILRMKLVPGHETDQAFYEFAYDNDNSVGIFVEKESETPFSTNQYDMNKPVPGTISFTKLDKTSKKVSGSFKIKVRRVTDNGEKELAGTFENLTFDDVISATPAKVMTASVDAASWTATAVLTASLTLQKTITIKGNAANGSSILLTLPYKTLPGTYNTAMFGSTAAQYNPTSVAEMKAETGNITITFHDPDAKVIKGTFSFLAKDDILGQKTITAGNFVGVY